MHYGTGDKENPAGGSTASGNSRSKASQSEASSELRLPAQTRLCGLLQESMHAESISRSSRRCLRALAQARGDTGDWSDATPAELDDLAHMLANGQRVSELTQILSDPLFLQRRLALGSHHQVLEDLEVCEAALEQTLTRQRYEQRFARADAALSRRHSLREIRHAVYLLYWYYSANADT